MKLEHAGSFRLQTHTKSLENPFLFVEDKSYIGNYIPRSVHKSTMKPSVYRSQSEGRISRTMRKILFNQRQLRWDSEWEDGEQMGTYEIRKWSAVILASSLVFVGDVGRNTIKGWLLCPLIAIAWWLKFFSEHTLHIEATGNYPTMNEYVFPHILTYVILLTTGQLADTFKWTSRLIVLASVIVMFRLLQRHRFGFYMERLLIQLLFPGKYFLWTIFHYFISFPVALIPVAIALSLSPTLRNMEWVPDKYKYVLENRGEHVLNG